MKRFSEQPSVAHVITTCFGLVYVLMLGKGWLSTLSNPFFDHSFSSWSVFGGFGLFILWAGIFLVRELVRQRRLFRKWKSS